MFGGVIGGGGMTGGGVTAGWRLLARVIISRCRIIRINTYIKLRESINLFLR
jgi:hypothetical protein